MYEESLPSSGPPVFKMEIYMQSNTRFNRNNFCNTVKAISASQYYTKMFKM